MTFSVQRAQDRRFISDIFIVYELSLDPCNEAKNRIDKKNYATN